MQIEMKIKGILKSQGTVDKKVEDITAFMDWDRKKLKSAILKYGTSGDEGRKDIMGMFWGKVPGRRRKIKRSGRKDEI